MRISSFFLSFYVSYLISISLKDKLGGFKYRCKANEYG